MQLYPDGTRHPVGYWSRSLNNAEKNCSVTEKECLSVVWGCQVLRSYLEGKLFVVYTDHQALKWLLGATNISGRLARWRIRLCEFDFSLEYKKGKKNTIADAISRLPTTGETEVDPYLDVPVLNLAPARVTLQRTTSPKISSKMLMNSMSSRLLYATLSPRCSPQSPKKISSAINRRINTASPYGDGSTPRRIPRLKSINTAF